METFLSQHAERAVLRMLEDLGSPRSLTVSLLIRNREFDQLSTLEIDPGNYFDAESFWRDTSATNIIRKLADLPTTVDRKAAAVENFFKCEKQCLASNIRLATLLEGSSDPFYPERLHGYFSRARKIVSQILGPCPDLVEGRFGPGATFADRGGLSTIPDKMTSEPTFTPDCLPFLFQWSGTLWASALAKSGKSPRSCRGNRFTTVRKDCRKDRGIAIEPSINVFYQLGYGRIIRDRLSHHGIYLDDGQDIHRRLACESSSDGRLATLDLSNASDTICRNLVKLLLPPRWYEALDMLRSKRTLINGHFHDLDKFSSMGNGFTFELETLIFLSLAAAVSAEARIGFDVFAYGDDLIIPTAISDDVIQALNFCGLTVNKEKTFVNGYFRESCGGDFFMGVDVRPFFLKEAPNEPHQLIAFANGIRRSGFGLARRCFVHRAWLTILDGLPVEIRRCRGPSDLGDLVIHDEQAFWQTTVFRKSPCVRYLRVWKPARFRTVSWANFAPDVILASAVYGMPWNEGKIIPRDSVSGYRFGWVAYS